MTRIVFAFIICGILAATSLPATAGQMNHDKKNQQGQMTGQMTGHAIKHGQLSLEQAWARATPPRAKNGAAYVTITNHGAMADKLIAAATDAAAKAELHTHIMTDGVMKMRQIPSIAVPAHGSTQAKPGGDHIMLMGLKKSLKAGEEISLTLTFEHAGPITIKVPIQKKPGMGKMHKHSNN